MNKKTIDTLNRLKQILINILCISCLTAMLLYLHDMGNEMYDNLKNTNAAKALLMLSLFMLLVQKTRLLNWQTLVASLLYWQGAAVFLTRNIDIPDLYVIDSVIVWVAWVLLLIVVDMVAYKKINPLTRFRPLSLCIFALMVFAMTYCRNGRSHPLIFVIAFIFYLIPISRTDWRRIINQFCSAWLITFFIVLYRSIKNNPELDETIGRWFGDFLNIGDFGLFIACVTAILLFKLYQSKQLYGRKSISYVLYLLCLFPLIWTIFRVSTITMFIGIIGIFLMGYILVRKDHSKKNIIFRLFSVVFCLVILLLAGLISLKILADTDLEYWQQVLHEGNTFLKPIANLVERAHYMFDKSRTFASSEIFEPGTLINYLDLFSSGRLSIIVSFAEYFSFTGNSSVGIQVGTYFAYNAHNTYAQMLYEYGYLGGGIFIVWVLYSTYTSARQYIRERKISQVLLCLWMPMSLGVFLGERVNLFAPIIIMTLLLTYPIMVQFKDTEKQQ